MAIVKLDFIWPTEIDTRYRDPESLWHFQFASSEFPVGFASTYQLLQFFS